jgi:hypothetical protein
MMHFQITLLPQGGGRWAALMDGQLLSTEIDEHPRAQIAAILLANGADPRSRLTIRAGARVIADDLLGWEVGRSVACGADVEVVERA